MPKSSTKARSATCLFCGKASVFQRVRMKAGIGGTIMGIILLAFMVPAWFQSSCREGYVYAFDQGIFDWGCATPFNALPAVIISVLVGVAVTSATRRPEMYYECMDCGETW